MYSLSFMVHIIPNQGLRFEASKTGEGLLARFEESRIKTERTGDHLDVADEERDGRVNVQYSTNFFAAGFCGLMAIDASINFPDQRHSSM